MSLLEEDRLAAIMPRAGKARVSTFLGPLNEAMDRWEIRSSSRVAAFLAQVAHESVELRFLEENLNYSGEALLRLWPRRFAPTEVHLFARQPERIANRVYASRMGNGDEASGDGWTYRGRGLLQVTGRENYRDASIGVVGDADTLLINPELVASPGYACETAAWFWASNGLNELADVNDFVAITRRINGGENGLADRVAHWHRALQAFA